MALLGGSPAWVERVREVDALVAGWMERVGHTAHRLTLGLLFVWLGLLKQGGWHTGTSLIGSVVYLGPPEVTVPLLGLWEVAIGVGLLWPRMVRIAILLLAVRLPGTLLALAIHADVAFEGSLLVPTVAGQFLIKDLLLFSSALVIGGAVRESRAER